MNKVFVFFIIMVLIGFSCTMDKRKTSMQNVVADTIVTDSRTEDIIIPPDSGVIRIDLVNGKARIKLQKKENEVIYVDFFAEGYTMLKGRLTSPDSHANIRFSQILLPDGTMDGPFGREIIYKMARNGLYELSIHENMMAGDPWSGVFYVQIELTK